MRSLCVIALAGATTLQCSANLFALQLTQTSANGQETSALEQKAKSGDAKAQVQLGLACATGDGVPKNEGEFVKCFRIAADQGDATSEYHLSEMYFTGRGVPVDFCEALKWLRKAAEQGDAHAQYNLAAMYAQGSGVSKDEVEVSGSGAGRRGVWPGLYVCARKGRGPQRIQSCHLVSESSGAGRPYSKEQPGLPTGHNNRFEGP